MGKLLKFSEPQFTITTTQVVTAPTSYHCVDRLVKQCVQTVSIVRGLVRTQLVWVVQEGSLPLYTQRLLSSKGTL